MRLSEWGNYFVGGSNASPTSKRITIKDDERNKSFAKTRVLDGIAGAKKMRLSFRYRGKKLDSNDRVKIWYRFDQPNSSSFNKNSGWLLWYDLKIRGGGRDNDKWYDRTLSTKAVPDGTSTVQIYFESDCGGSKHKLYLDNIRFEKLS